MESGKIVTWENNGTKTIETKTESIGETITTETKQSDLSTIKNTENANELKSDNSCLKSTAQNVTVVENQKLDSLLLTTKTMMGQLKENDTESAEHTKTQLKEGSQTHINYSAGTVTVQKHTTEYVHTKNNVTIVTGGFPCQSFSQAGKRKGTDDARWKWPEMFRVVQEVKPDWVIAENVRGFTNWGGGVAFRQVLSDLEGEGYGVQSFIIPAVAIGAPHRRDRVWIIANLRSEKPRGVSNSKREEIREIGNRNWNQDWREVAFATCHDGVDDGLPRKLDGATYRGKPTDCISAAQHRKERLKACGNAIVPQVAMEIFRAIKEADNTIKALLE